MLIWQYTWSSKYIKGKKIFVSNHVCIRVCGQYIKQNFPNPGVMDFGTDARVWFFHEKDHTNGLGWFRHLQSFLCLTKQAGTPSFHLTGSVSCMSATSIRQHSANYTAPCVIRASRHEREPSWEKILLIQSEYVCFNYPVWLFETRSTWLCNSYFFVVAFFRHVFGKHTTCTKNSSQEQCDIASTEAEQNQRKGGI